MKVFYFINILLTVTSFKFDQNLHQQLVEKWTPLLEDQLLPYKSGINKELIENTIEHGSHVVFQHLNGSLKISDPSGYCFCNRTFYSPELRWEFHISRCQAMATILSALLEHTKMPEFEFVWSLDDLPYWAVKTLTSPSDRMPGFGAIRCWSKGNLAMPFYGSHSDFNFDRLERKRPWREQKVSLENFDQRKPELIFRGGLERGCSFSRNTVLNFNGYQVFTPHMRNNTCGRAKLLKLAKEYPEIINYRGPADQWIDLDSQEETYRYILSIEGFGGWADRLGELLSRKMLVFNQNHPCDQWFEPTLKPEVHYLPVDNDFANLIGQIEWAKQHPKTVKNMVNESEQWSNEYLSPTGIISYMYTLLNLYSKLVTYPVSPRKASVPVEKLWKRDYIAQTCQ